MRENSDCRIECGNKLLTSDRVEFNLDLSSHLKFFEMMGSYKGKIIECLYSVEINANIDRSGGMCCGGELPSIMSPINIVPDFIIEPVIPVAPLNWNPQLLDRVNIRY